MQPVVRSALRQALPLALAAIPFGLVYGVAVVDSSLSSWTGLSASWLILAGASQISLVELIDGGAVWPVAVGTVLVINARHALYSAALAPAFAHFPKRWRFTLPYLMTDQAATLSINEFATLRDAVQRRYFTLQLRFSSPASGGSGRSSVWSWERPSRSNSTSALRCQRCSWRCSCRP